MLYTINCKGKLLAMHPPCVMGIINVTPDSFYAASRHQALDAIIAQAGTMLAEGASIVDIGAQSTRPGAVLLDAREEADRLIAAIAAVHANFPNAIISADTFHAAVAAEAVAAGAAIINDVSGGMMDEAMLPTVAALGVPYVCMHMPGTPATMQAHTNYDDVVQTVLDFFIGRVHDCHQAGIRDVIIDPGFGFGKTIAQNFLLLKKLELFKLIGCPILLGVSRKSSVYKTLGVGPEDALNGTTVLNTIGLLNGAHILRVHDVKPAMEAIKLFNAWEQASQ